MTQVWTWIVEHWVAIGLTVSEIAALLPTKYKGILQTVITLVGAFLKPQKQE